MFRILTVCTGNICRSPLAAHLLQSKLGHERIDVQSAGVGALEGAPMPDPAQDIAARLGLIWYADHQGKQISSQDAVTADLILALDRGHRRRIVELHPPAVRYTYTLTEFAHIASNMPESDLSEILQRADSAEHGALEAVSRSRGVVPPLESPDALDIADPYRRPIEVYEQSSAQIVTAVDSIVAYFNHTARLHKDLLAEPRRNGH
ncbi:MAG: hypothetical protein ACTHWM_06480 [Yaniella sp.]|uniref:arsenate reductase/protein-tyrosine-phosphatase family protein n=1 Tax=Yaniella sp. TaxID=2773929 RepID=UPI003F9A3C09